MQAHSPMSRGPADAPPALPQSRPPAPRSPGNTQVAPHDDQPAAPSKLTDCRLGTFGSMLMLSVIVLTAFTALGMLQNTQLPPIAIVLGSVLGLAFSLLFVFFIGMICFYVFGRSPQAFRVGTGVILGLSSLGGTIQAIGVWHPATAQAMTESHHLDASAAATNATPADHATNTPPGTAGAGDLSTEQAVMNVVQRADETRKAVNFAHDCYALAGGADLSKIETKPDLSARMARLEDLRVATVARRDALRQLPDELRTLFRARGVPEDQVEPTLKKSLEAIKHSGTKAATKASLRAIEAQNAYFAYALDNFDHWGMNAEGRTVWSTRTHADAFNALSNEAERAINEVTKTMGEQIGRTPAASDLVNLPRALSVDQAAKPKESKRAPR